MTVTTDSTTVTVNTVDARGKNVTLTIPVTEVTNLTDALLAARKAAYEAARTERNTAKASAKAEREAKKAARLAAATARRENRIATLELKLASLKA